MKKILSKSLLGLVGASTFVLTALAAKVSLSQSSGWTGVITTPDVKVTQHIHEIDHPATPAWPWANPTIPSACMQELDLAGFNYWLTVSPWTPASVAVCSALDLADNYDWQAPWQPGQPWQFTNVTWEYFKASKQYRGYLHLPSHQVVCDEGRVSLIANTWPDGLEYSFGFTPNHLNPITRFDPAEPYTPEKYGKSKYNTYSYIRNSANTSVTLTYRRASRLGKFESDIQYGWTGYDAPFIYTDLQILVQCNGTPPAITVNRSVFPTTRLYINNKLAKYRLQKNLAGFIKSGGTTQKPVGFGNLALSGDGIYWPLKNLTGAY